MSAMHGPEYLSEGAEERSEVWVKKVWECVGEGRRRVRSRRIGSRACIFFCWLIMVVGGVVGDWDVLYWFF